MDRSVHSSDGMGQGSVVAWNGALNKENNNSNENISASNDNVGPVIRILEIEAKIDKEPTQVDESSSAVLKYRTPNFSTSWEFPELTSGKQTMISDCDGRHYPWYGSRNETVIFKGPCDRYQTATVYMNDNFHPHVTWRNPANRHQLEPNLTHIIRDQSFYVWLVAWNMVTMKSFVMQIISWRMQFWEKTNVMKMNAGNNKMALEVTLRQDVESYMYVDCSIDQVGGTDSDIKIRIQKTISWCMQLEIAIDPRRPLGTRATLISNPVPRQPIILDYNVPIPRCALTPPCANSAQMLVWHPRRGKPVCVIPPVWKSQCRSPKRESKL